MLGRHTAKEHPGQSLQLHTGALGTADRFLEYPMLELSNNLAENAIRTVALEERIVSTSAVRMPVLE